MPTIRFTCRAIILCSREGRPAGWLPHRSIVYPLPGCHRPAPRSSSSDRASPLSTSSARPTTRQRPFLEIGRPRVDGKAGAGDGSHPDLRPPAGSSEDRPIRRRASRRSLWSRNRRGDRWRRLGHRWRHRLRARLGDGGRAEARGRRRRAALTHRGSPRRWRDRRAPLHALPGRGCRGRARRRACPRRPRQDGGSPGDP